MANVFSVNVYQIGSQEPLPTANIGLMSFPSAGCIFRSINGGNGVRLSTNQVVYGTIQVVSNGALFSVLESRSQLATLAG